MSYNYRYIHVFIVRFYFFFILVEGELEGNSSSVIYLCNFLLTCSGLFIINLFFKNEFHMQILAAKASYNLLIPSVYMVLEMRDSLTQSPVELTDFLA